MGTSHPHPMHNVTIAGDDHTYTENMPNDLQTQRCRRFPRVLTMTIARDPRTLWRVWQIQRSAKNQTQIDNRPSLILHRPLPMATDHNNLMVSGQTEYAVRRNLTLSGVRFGGVSDTMDLAHGARYHTGPGTRVHDLAPLCGCGMRRKGVA